MEDKLILVLGTFLLLVGSLVWVYRVYVEPLFREEIAQERSAEHDLIALVASLTDQAAELHQQAEAEKVHRRHILEKLNQWHADLDREAEELKRACDTHQVAVRQRAALRERGVALSAALAVLQRESITVVRQELEEMFANRRMDEKFIKRIVAAEQGNGEDQEQE